MFRLMYQLISAGVLVVGVILKQFRNLLSVSQIFVPVNETRWPSIKDRGPWDTIH